MKNELQRIKDNYIVVGGRYKTFSDRVANKLLKMIDNSIVFEQPDFFCLDNNTCFIFEHFEFDASKTLSKKGSLFKIEEKNTERIMNKKTVEKLRSKKPNTEDVTTYGAFATGIKSNQNQFDWKENFLRVFSKHYDKLDKYKMNLTEKNIINDKTKMKNIFVIEDTTELGAFENIDSGKICYPFCFDFGVKTLKKAKRITYFIFLNKAQNEMVFINRGSLKIIEKLQLNFDETKMFFFNNIVSLSAIVSVPNKLLKKKK